MFGLSTWEILIFAGIIVLLFGGARLPGLMRNMGRSINEFKTGIKEQPAEVPPVEGETADGQAINRHASDDEPFSALVFKIMTDPYVGSLAFIRVYSGCLQSGSAVYNSTQGRKERIGRLLKMHANKREEIQRVWAGDIAAAVGLKTVKTGDTICDSAEPVLLESIDSPAPVISVAIEPKTQVDLESGDFTVDEYVDRGSR